MEQLIFIGIVIVAILFFYRQGKQTNKVLLNTIKELDKKMDLYNNYINHIPIIEKDIEVIEKRLDVLEKN